ITSLVGGAALALYGIVTGAQFLGMPAEIYSALLSLFLFILVSVITRKEA
ncbi:MAG: Sodium:solute symporter family protein, partial [bacterium 42_11]